MSHEHLCPRGHQATAAQEREHQGGSCPGVIAPEESRGLFSSTGSFLEHRSHHRAGTASSPTPPGWGVLALQGCGKQTRGGGFTAVQGWGFLPQGEVEEGWYFSLRKRGGGGGSSHTATVCCLGKRGAGPSAGLKGLSRMELKEDDK